MLAQLHSKALKWCDSHHVKLAVLQKLWIFARNYSPNFRIFLYLFLVENYQLIIRKSHSKFRDHENDDMDYGFVGHYRDNVPPPTSARDRPRPFLVRHDDYGPVGGPEDFREARPRERLDVIESPAEARIKQMKKEMMEMNQIQNDFDEPYIPKPKAEHGVQRRISNVSFQ